MNNTPESDECYSNCVKNPGPGNGVIMRKKMRELELQRNEARRLAREANAWLKHEGYATNYPPMPWEEGSPEYDPDNA